jgi:uncharacterized protein
VNVLLRKMVFFPDRCDPGPAPAGARDVRLRAEDGVDLGAWFFGTGNGGSGVGVLVANGNGGNRRDLVGLARALAAEGMSALLFDYRGYGGNGGRPSEAGLRRDARAARAWLLGEGGVAPDRLLYLGESLGTGVVAGLAVEHPPAGLLLRSPFTSLVAVGRAHYPYLPVGLLLRDRFDVAAAVARVAVPTAVVYGDADRIVPPAQSRAVAAAAAGPVDLVVLPGADHNDPALCEGRELVRAAARLA